MPETAWTMSWVLHQTFTGHLCTVFDYCGNGCSPVMERHSQSFPIYSQLQRDLQILLRSDCHSRYIRSLYPKLPPREQLGVVTLITGSLGHIRKISSPPLLKQYITSQHSISIHCFLHKLVCHARNPTDVAYRCISLASWSQGV